MKTLVLKTDGGRIATLIMERDLVGIGYQEGIYNKLIPASEFFGKWSIKGVMYPEYWTEEKAAEVIEFIERNMVL